MVKDSGGDVVQLSVVMPCLNEEEAVGVVLLDRCLPFLRCDRVVAPGRSGRLVLARGIVHTAYIVSVVVAHLLCRSWHAGHAARQAVVVDEDGGPKLGRVQPAAVDGAVGAEQGRGQRWQGAAEAVVVEEQDAEVASVDESGWNGAGEGVVLKSDYLEVRLVCVDRGRRRCSCGEWCLSRLVRILGLA